MPLTAASGGAGMMGLGQEEPQELPAWLESLRAHEKPVASNSGAQPFTMDELVDENSMPSWMRQDQSRLAEAGASDAFPVVPPTAQQAPGSNLEASSLIDKQALPEWMRATQENDSSAPAGQGFSANSLVQQETLPEWMKNLASTAEQPTVAQPATKNYGLPATPPVGASRAPQTPAPFPEPTPEQGFPANSLVDQQEMPDWMKGAQGTEQQGQSRSGPLGSGFAAGELIDQRTLPNWMKDQQGRENANPVSAMGVPVSGSGQTTGMDQGTTGDVGMPASTLVDQSSLPTWMSEGNQADSPQGTPQPGNGMSAGSLVDMNAMPTWLKNSENAPQHAGSPQHTQQTSGGMSAGSLVDMNAMPTWLKNSENAQPGAGQSAGARSVPARAEGMRVPSRPRGNMDAQGQNSEAAAHVFSSMLGVAASTPQLPGAPGHQLGVAPGQQPQTAWQSPQQLAGRQASQVWQAPISPIPQERHMGNTPTPSPMPYNTSAGQPGVYGNMQPYPGPVGNGEANRPIPGQSAPGFGYTPGSGPTVNRQSGGIEEPKKKSLFEAIRDFFFH